MSLPHAWSRDGLKCRRRTDDRSDATGPVAHDDDVVARRGGAAFESVAVARVAVVTIAPRWTVIRLDAAWGSSPVLRMAGHQTFSQVHASWCLIVLLR
jgi:hypothetical protein